MCRVLLIGVRQGALCMCGLVKSSIVFFKQKTAYEMRISDWSSDVCSSDLRELLVDVRHGLRLQQAVQAARAVDEVVLVAAAAVDPQGLQLLQVPGVPPGQHDRVPLQPVGPALGNTLAGLRVDRRSEERL